MNIDVNTNNDIIEWIHENDKYLLNNNDDIIDKNMEQKYNEVYIDNIFKRKPFKMDLNIITMNNDIYSNKLAIICNCYINDNGNIFISDNVYRTTKYTYYKNIIKTTIKYPDNIQNIPVYDEVICLSGECGAEPYHFIFEFLYGLNVFKNININTNTIFIHVTKKNKLLCDSIKLCWNFITDEQIIDGLIHAKKLYVPEFLVDTGIPYIWHIKWLQNIVQNNIFCNNNQYNKIILVKRNFRRQIYNFDELYDFVKNYAIENNLDLYIHDDTCMPSFVDQLTIFSEAKIIITPHGASEINLLSCSKNTKVIELMDVKYKNLCFARISYFLGLQHYIIHTIKYTVDIQNLKNILQM